MEEQTLSQEAAILDLVLQDGRTLSRRVIHPTGSPLNPVSDTQLEIKLKSLVGDVLPMSQTEQLMDQLWQMDSIEDIRNLLLLTLRKQ